MLKFEPSIGQVWKHGDTADKIFGYKKTIGEDIHNVVKYINHVKACVDADRRRSPTITRSNGTFTVQEVLDAIIDHFGVRLYRSAAIPSKVVVDDGV